MQKVITMKKTLSLCLALLMCLSICACSNTSSKEDDKPKTEREIVLEKIEQIGRVEYTIWTINNNKLKSSTITVATLEKTEDNLYYAYGKIVFVDVYGDIYEKNVELSLTQNYNGWWELKSIDIEDFEYEMLYH